MLPTCPACQQSVLDDDAENCPFCGANMKTGKGGGKAPTPKAVPKPAAKPSASAASAPAPAATSKSAPAKAAAKSQENDEDDPFGFDAASNSRAVPLVAKPAKGKTVRLVCPMCETPGFAGPEVAGKEVKCCNEQCALPIFTAPKGDRPAAGADPRTPAAGMKTVVAPPAKKKASPAMVMTAVCSMLMAGGSLWYFVFNEPGGVRPPPPPPPVANINPGPVTTIDPATEKSNDPKPAEKVPSNAEKLRSTILPVIVELSRETTKNRSKYVCRRLAAEAYIEAGDSNAAQENIDQLLKLTPRLAYHQVLPLTQLAWRELAAGNADASKTALDAAWKAAPELPTVFSRLTFDATTDLAALLFVSGRAGDAQNLMNAEGALPSGSSGTLAALSRRSHLLHSFDIDEAAAMLPVIPWKSPQWVVTTMTLVLRGHANKAVEWLKLAPDAQTKADCWAVWGDSVLAANFADAMTKDEPIATAIKEDSPAMQARVWARVAAARLAAKQPAAAKQAAVNAETAMDSVPLPKDFVLLEMKELMKLQLPDAITPRLNAIAAAEVARSQTLLGQKEVAAKTLAAALQHLRGHAPCPFAAGKLFDATSRDSNAVKAQLKTALNLKTDDKVQQALTTYREKCRSALDAANARFALQTEILKAAVDWPLVDAVWTEASAHSAEGTADEAREDFLKTNLSVRLEQRLKAAVKTDQARQCANFVTTGELTDARDTLQREAAEEAQKGGDVASVARRLAAYETKPAEGEKTSSEDPEWTLLWGLRLACRLVKAGKTDKAFELVSGFTKDTLWREEGYEMLAAMTAKDPVAAEVLWKKYRPTLLTPTEKIAIFRGLCAGLSSSLAAKP